MCAKSITFDLELSNKIFKANLKSLIDISAENIVILSQQNIEYFITSGQKTKEGKETETDWFDKGSHFANAEWLLLNSIYISFCSFFEHHLFALAKVVEERTSSKIKINDMSGTGINKFAAYLNLVGEIQHADRSNTLWQVIQKYQKVRNIIVHNGGIMVSDLNRQLEDHELFNFLKSHGVVMAGSLGHIRIRNVSFLESFAKTTYLISDNLTEEIDNKYPNKWK